MTTDAPVEEPRRPIFDEAAIRRHALLAELLGPDAAPAEAPAREKKPLSKAAIGALVGGHGLDAVSTLMALDRGAVESNPLLGDQPSAGKLLGVKAGTVALSVFLAKLLANQGHPKIANAVFDRASLERHALQAAFDPPAEVREDNPDRKKGLSKWALAALIGGQGLDTASTAMFLNQGIKERNPVFGENPSLGRLLATKAGATAVIALLSKLLADKGHPKIGNALAAGSGAVGAGAGIYNLAGLKED